VFAFVNNFLEHLFFFKNRSDKKREIYIITVHTATKKKFPTIELMPAKAGEEV